jgi:hypothetical protein
MSWTMPVNAAVLNATFTGVLLGLIVTTVRGGATGLTTGSVIAVVSLGSLAGALLAPAVSRRLSMRQALVAVTWTCAVMIAAMALTRTFALLAVLGGACALRPGAGPRAQPGAEPLTGPYG